MSRLYALSDVIEREVSRLRSGNTGRSGLPSGIGLSRLVPGGIPRDKVTVFYSDEGSFKTTVVTQVLVSMAEAGHKVLNVTLEDSAELVAHRFMARRSGVPFGVIHGGLMSPEQLASVTAVSEDMASANLQVVDSIEPSIDRVFAAVKAIPGCAAVVVDYIQLLASHRTLKDTLDHTMRQAQLFAKEHNVAVIFVSQNKDDESHRDDPRPKTRDMFGSSAMRMGVKLAVGLFRPFAYCKVPTNPKGPYGMYVKWLAGSPQHRELYPNILEVHITKQVSGPACAYHALVNPETGVVEAYSGLREYA